MARNLNEVVRSWIGFCIAGIIFLLWDTPPPLHIYFCCAGRERWFRYQKITALRFNLERLRELKPVWPETLSSYIYLMVRLYWKNGPRVYATTTNPFSFWTFTFCLKNLYFLFADTGHAIWNAGMNCQYCVWFVSMYSTLNKISTVFLSLSHFIQSLMSDIYCQ